MLDPTAQNVTPLNVIFLPNPPMAPDGPAASGVISPWGRQCCARSKRVIKVNYVGPTSCAFFVCVSAIFVPQFQVK